jgi:tRNA (cytidine/uridine-2'-O-)-methyltransferase
MMARVDADTTLYLPRLDEPLNIVLVNPLIPPNTGNVARLCAVTGSRLHLVAPLGFSLDEKQLKRAGLDYWDKVHAATWASFDELVAAERIAPERAHLFTGRVSERSRPLWEAHFAPGDWLILGEEAKGLPDAVLDRFPDAWVRVPMIREPSARSLNLSTCAGIAVYEALRQCATAAGAGRKAESPDVLR